LSSQLAIIVKKYIPEVVIIGGGILKRKNFFKRFKKEFARKMKEKGIKTKLKKSASADSAAIGAALLTILAKKRNTK
jgi:predicted NBD/HSP70 family sugar kinase